MWFTRISIQNPVLATMMMLALLVLGLFSYQRMAIEALPDVSFPVVVVQTTYPGASPENVESDVTRPIEEAVNSVNGIDTLTSRSYEGVSVVIIQFNLAVNAALAAQDVREKVAAVRSTFRKEIDEPRVTRYDPADTPIISYSVSAPGNNAMSLRDLTTYADQVIKKRLENVRGVGSVTIVGGVKREVQIYLKPDQMEALSVSVDQVLNAIRNENQELPTGAIRSLENEKIVQVEGRIKNPEDFRRIIVARRGSGTALQPVTLEQVATVIDGQEERDNLALFNDQPTLALQVLKAQGENTIQVVDGLSEALATLKPSMPRGVQVQTVRDSSIAIRNSVAGVKESIIEGAALTILIVFLFLNSWRSTVITGLTLPIALIGTFLFMYISNFTINSLTLMALSLCVGLLIDDAIVVRENIVRHAGMKIKGVYKNHRQAALDGTKEIGLAVLATTFSIVAVFMPVGFMGGIIGRFFHQFGITVVAAVLISMFVSFTLDPMLSSVWPDPDAHREPGYQPRTWLGRFLAFFDRRVQGLSHWYQDILGWALKHRGRTLLLALAVFIGSLMLAPLVGSEFVPAGDYSETSISFNTPVGSSLELTEAKAQQVNAALHEFPEVKYTYTTINTGAVQGKNYATIYVRLTERKDRKRSQDQLTQPIRARLSRIAGVTVTQVSPPANGGPGGKTLQVSLQGTNLKELERLSLDAQEKLRKIPGLVDLDSSLKEPKPTVAIQINRELASDLGIGVAQIGNALRPLLAGEDASTWRGPDDENYSVTVRLTPDARNSFDDLNRLMLASTQLNPDGSPKMVPLRQVATITPSTGASQINRSDLAREVSLDANVYGRAAGNVSADMEKVLKTLDYPPGYRYKMGGSTKSLKESFGYAISALMLAVIFIYMILASQFHSFLQPIAIMTALPLTLIGVLLALLLFGSTINLFTMIGIIMLMGLVTKNAILLIDFANQARRGDHDGEHGQPLERADALLAAARVRLRPILMTTLAMIFGMLPLALALTEGSEQRAPLGQSIIGGVITSSLLTLVVVPVMYTYLDDFAVWVKTRGNKNKSHNPSQEITNTV